MSSLRLVFAGTPEFALPCLQALAASHHQLLAIYTQPDRPSGRGQNLLASPVKNWAQNKNIPIEQPEHFKHYDSLEIFERYAPDLLVVIAYGLILPQAVLDTPKLGCINVHASLLPRWRGASPIQQALLHGDKQTGITIMQMDAGMDTGDVLMKKSYLISPEETAGELHNQLAHLAIKPLLTTIQDLALGKAHPKPQNHDDATYAPKILKADARINWQESAHVIERQVRAYNPWPIAYTEFNNTTLRIHKARVLELTHDAIAGTILALDKTGMSVATGHHILLVERIQFPGKKIVSVADWLNAKRDALTVSMVLQ